MIDNLNKVSKYNFCGPDTLSISDSSFFAGNVQWSVFPSTASVQITAPATSNQPFISFPQNSTTDTIQYRILLNPTLTGNTWTTHYNGNVDYNITATAVTGGTDIIGGYISSSGSLSVSNINDFNFQLGRTQAGVSDIFCVVFIPVNNGAIVYTDLSWFEII